ncbi:MAG: dihydroorotase [Crocinitomicaceae bacterium]|nr:dihydroorotase [Crocinitomicaceae bacterium]|tara:strand:+ start:19950 stop:21287 length:1338 start_codon:yes stop_codon:yes gene_type:complete
MSTILIQNVSIVNQGKTTIGNVLIEGTKISTISKEEIKGNFKQIIDGKNLHLIPGMIDDQVHFREPGLTHKANIETESRAAVAGGITSFMEMPNTVPNTVTQELLADKYVIAQNNSLANYSFYMGATNNNLDEVLKTDPSTVCGVKIFMGSSTGNMLVDNKSTLEDIFKNCKLLIATHCEDEQTIINNTALFKQKYGENLPIKYHPLIRNEEACYKSSSMAADLAAKHNTRLHILHISTEKELALFNNTTPLKEKRITAEACIHHLWFNDSYYDSKGTLIKWNPAVKTENDRAAILNAVNNNIIDVIATDHAPHTIEEKNNPYFKAPSGGPLVQHAILALLELAKKGETTIEKIVEKTSHSVADIYQINKRGYIKEGYYADLVLVNLNKTQKVTKDSLYYKCGWSPFENQEFNSTIKCTIVNGHLAYCNGAFNTNKKGMRLTFNR